MTEARHALHLHFPVTVSSSLTPPREERDTHGGFIAEPDHYINDYVDAVSLQRLVAELLATLESVRVVGNTSQPLVMADASHGPHLCKSSLWNEVHTITTVCCDALIIPQRQSAAWVSRGTVQRHE